jgi:probable F420-dependent oxidoreductase
VLRLAADRTAGAHPYLVTPEHTRQARELLGAGPLLAPEQHVVVEPDPERARALARAALAYYLQLSNYLANFRRLGFGDADLADGGSDALVDALVAHGSADDVAARVRAHVDVGADHVAVNLVPHEGEDVAATLGALAGALTG